jgi:hypothetical protein
VKGPEEYLVKRKYSGVVTTACVQQRSNGQTFVDAWERVWEEAVAVSFSRDRRMRR